MIPLLFVLLCLSLLIFILLADHVRTRFQHTPHSRRVLAVEGGVVLALAALAARVLGPRLELASWALLTLVVAAPVYVLTAFVTVEVWRRRKQGGFDREIARLAREHQRWQHEVERLEWEIKDLERQRASREQESQRLEARVRALEDQLQAWEAASAGRGRAVELWSAELAALNDLELQARREELAARVSVAEEGERAELGARLTLVDLILLRRTFLGPGGPGAELDQRLSQLRESRARAERRLAQVREELQRWQERKTAFLREKIPLD